MLRHQNFGKEVKNMGNAVVTLTYEELDELDYAPARFEDYAPCHVEIEIQQAMLEWPDNFFTLPQIEVFA
jgi:hypothetical protein